MVKLATKEAVWATCNQLITEGRKVTGRAVQKEIGGSLTTIFYDIDTWLAKDAKATVVTSELPESLQKSIAVVIEQKAQQATAVLQTELADVTEREKEVMEALAESETRINILENELSSAQDKITAHQQARDKETAVAVERVAGLDEQIIRLVNERNDSASSANTSKMELVKAQIHLEHAVQRAVRAEDKIVVLEQQVAELMQSKSEAENKLAVSIQHAEELTRQVTALTEQLQSAGDKLSKADSVITELSLDLKEAALKQNKAEGSAEQILLRLQESSATVEHLRNEQSAARKDAAYITELLGLYAAEKESAAELKPPIESMSVGQDSVEVPSVQIEAPLPASSNVTLEEIQNKVKKYDIPKSLEIPRA